MALESQTEENFLVKGRLRWEWLKESTKAPRFRRNKGSSLLKILQDSSILAASLLHEYGNDFARLSAAIHQFSGNIERPAHQAKVCLRTDAKGQFLRQSRSGRAANLAVFATNKYN
jgi:phage gpG-like protein